MFKKLLPIITLLAIVTAANSYLLYPVYAIEATTTSSSAASLRQAKIEAEKAALREKAENRKLVIEEKLEARKTAIENRIDLRKEAAATRAAALKSRLEKFKDKKKATIAARINDNLNAINDRRSTAFLNHLTKMTEILTRLENKLSEASSTGKDTSSATAAIASAKTAISTAQTAATAQQGKDYTIEVSSEAKLQESIKPVRDQLHTDLKSVHDLVVAARKATSEAISTTVSTLGGVKNGE